MQRIVGMGRLVSVFFFFFLYISPTLVGAEELPIVTGEFPPFSFKHPTTEKIIGFNTEIITEVFKSMGKTPNISFSVFKRAYISTKEGEYAAYFALTKNPQREKDFYFSDPISSVQDVIFKLKSEPITWETYKDLAHYTLGYSDKYNYDQIFLATIQKKDSMSGDNPEYRLLKKLALRRIDIVICEISVCSYIIHHNLEELGSIDFINKPVGIPEPRPFHLVFSKNWPGSKKLRDDFNIALKKFVSRSDNPRKTLIEKYGASCSGILFPECR